MKTISVLGTRGIPAEHGGFETFAEYLAKYLVALDWEVTVYCQNDNSIKFYTSNWENIRCIHIPSFFSGPLGTICFDLLSIIHAACKPSVQLVLGYNTAVFLLISRLARRKIIVNMDGIEWKRSKWNMLLRGWFWLNEKAACILSTHLIADNPGIETHLLSRLTRRKMTMIPYGAEPFESHQAPVVNGVEVEPFSYMIVVARPEPENSIAEIVRAYDRVGKGKLLILGRYNIVKNRYHKLVKSYESSKIVFLGPIYNQKVVSCLRHNSTAYLHGHQVGGTNPSLVEALASGCGVIAYDNSFNKWVAKDAALYFKNEEELEKCICKIESDSEIRKRLAEAATVQFRSRFRWDKILGQYQILIDSIFSP